MRLAIVAALVLAAPAAARAYPQFQLSTGNVRCNQCHYAPAGGGLLNGYGREEAQDAISMDLVDDVIRGAMAPKPWIAFGADLRGAAVIVDEDSRKGVDTRVFPMQADLYLRVGTSQLSAYVAAGFRGATRPVKHSFASRLISREHFLMWRQGPTGWYARAGRFFAPYGLRLAEHTAYVRRFLGFNVLEETYNVSGGYVSDAWELHATAFTPDFWRDPVGQRGSGGAVYYERRAGKGLAWGAQARVTKGDNDLRATGGLVGKLYLDGPRLQLLGEADLVHQSFDDFSGAGRWQLLAYAGAAWFPVRGLMTQLMLERWDEDLEVKGVARDAVGAEVQLFPLAHVELSIYGRLAMLGSGTDDGPLSKVVLFQIHVYL